MPSSIPVTNLDTQESSHLICDIDHPVFDIVDNDTRRKILRLIACEHNYGNRIANILNLSTPAIHRHLKYLSGKNPGDISLIDVYQKTNLSHSGHKGGEAQLYKIKAKIGMFFHIFPNYVHNHIIELDEGQEPVLKATRESYDTFDNLEPEEAKTELDEKDLKAILTELREISEEPEEIKKESTQKIGDENLFAAFRHIYETLQKQNDKIRELEEQLLDLMSIKNDFMGILDNILQSQQDLGYEERVILRAITCLGKRCSADLSHLMNLDQYMIDRYISGLKEKNWLKK